MRIGLISDTHEADDALAVVGQLRSLQCDYNVHLGDIGGSRTSRELVREYKENGRALERLTPAQRAQYDALVSSGTRGVLAWLHAVTADNPLAAQQRRRETAESYDAIVGAMKSLPNAMFLAGNVEHIVGRGETIRRTFGRHGVELITGQRVLLLAGGALVLWPSPHLQEMDEGALVRLADELSEETNGRRPVIVVAHEQIFRGPTPGVYRARVEATGRPPASIPFYEPSAARLGILRFFRRLPASVPAGIVHGHIHDPNEVIAAGAPYLRAADGKGLSLRLYGLGRRCEGPGERTPGRRRTIRSFCVPAGRAVVLTLERGDYRLDAAPSL
ncbi:MAG: metallophosphoesterase [Bacteroidetes bacterium]|nr:metallophosphoesterase [Bacteroidota bacterium]